MSARRNVFNEEKFSVVNTTQKKHPITNLKKSKESQEWLKLNFEPFSEVLIKWEETFPYRNNMIENMQLDEIFHNWPLFHNSKAHEMVSELVSFKLFSAQE